jgi:hypothetical protein
VYEIKDRLFFLRAISTLGNGIKISLSRVDKLCIFSLHQLFKLLAESVMFFHQMQPVKRAGSFRHDQSR